MDKNCKEEEEDELVAEEWPQQTRAVNIVQSKRSQVVREGNVSQQEADREDQGHDGEEPQEEQRQAEHDEREQRANQEQEGDRQGEGEQQEGQRRQQEEQGEGEQQEGQVTEEQQERRGKEEQQEEQGEGEHQERRVEEEQQEEQVQEQELKEEQDRQDEMTEDPSEEHEQGGEEEAAVEANEDQDETQFVFNFDLDDDENEDNNENNVNEDNSEDNDNNENDTVDDEKEWNGTSNLPNPSCLKDELATVIDSSQHTLWLRISSTQLAFLHCGTHFLNGASSIHEVCQSDLEAKRFFNVSMSVSIDAIKIDLWPRIPTKLRQKFHFDSSNLDIYEATFLYVGPNRPPEMSSIERSELQLANKQVANRVRRVYQTVLRRSRSRWTGLISCAERATWFSIKLDLPSKLLKHPQNAGFKQKTAIVESVDPPHGGVVVVNDEHDVHRVRFHRSRVFVEGNQISSASDIKQVLEKGTVVTVDYVETEKAFETESSLEIDQKDAKNDEDDIKYTALLVCTSHRMEALNSPIWHPLLRKVKSSLENSPFYIAKIKAFDAPNEITGYIESGTAEILASDYKTNLNCRSQVLKETNLRLDQSSKVAKFDRKDLFLNGHSLAKADLARVFSVADFGLNTFYCQIEEENSDPKQYRVKLGWKPCLQLWNPFEMATVQSMWSDVDEMCVGEQLLMPRLVSWHTCRLYKELLFSLKDLESFLNGQKERLMKSGVYWGRVSNVSNVNRDGFVNINYNGQNKQGFFKIENVTVFGHNLKRANVNEFLGQNDLLQLKIDEQSINLADDDHFINIQKACLGHDLSFLRDSAADEMELQEDEKRHRLALYMDCRNFRDLQHLRHKLSDGKREQEAMERVPMFSEINEGIVVKMEDSVSHAYKEIIKDLEKRLTHVEGVVMIERGALRGQLVAFSKRKLWLFGQNMAKARRDLLSDKLNLLNEQVCVEAKKAFKNDRPYYKANIVWVGKDRPENDDDPRRHLRLPADHREPECIEWMKERALEVKHLLLVGAGNRIEDEEELKEKERKREDKNKRKDNKGRDDRSRRGDEREKSKRRRSVESDRRRDNKSRSESTKRDSRDASSSGNRRQVGQVLRQHGEMKDNLLSRALAVRGPDDLEAIGNVIHNDSEAEVAFHVYNALDRAMKHYRSLCIAAQQQIMIANNPLSYSLTTPLGQLTEMHREQRRNRRDEDNERAIKRRRI